MALKNGKHTLEAFPGLEGEHGPFNPAKAEEFSKQQNVVITFEQVVLVNKLCNVVTQHLEIPLGSLLSSSRQRECIRGRVLLAYFLTTRTNMSYVAIGCFMPNKKMGRNHSTISNAMINHGAYLFRKDVEMSYLKALAEILCPFSGIPTYYRNQQLKSFVDQELEVIQTYGNIKKLQQKKSEMANIKNTNDMNAFLRKELELFVKHLGLKKADHIIDRYLATRSA